jgi:hypothetical protein
MKIHKKLFFVLIIVLALMASTLSGALAGSTSKVLSTNYTLVNFSTENDAAVTVGYMKDDGSPWDADPENESFIIPKNFGMNQVRQYFDDTLTPGQGSVVATSTQPLGAIVQIQARNQTPTQGAYTGYSQGSNLFYVPLAAKQRSTASGIANSQIVIQNTDDFDFAARIDLYSGSTLSHQKTTPTLKPGQSYYYDLADDTELASGWIGSAVVTGLTAGKVAVVSNFFTGPNAMQTFNGFPQESVGPSWIIPLFFSRLANGLSAVVTVQNLSGGAIAAGAISLDCKADNVSTPATISVTNPGEIADKASYSFNPVTDKVLFPDDKWGGSCMLDAGSNDVVVIVQMRYVGVSNQGAAAYEAISQTGATGKLMVVPLVAKRLPNGFASVVTIQNMDPDNTASVTLTYMPSFNLSECPLASCDINHDGFVNASDAIVVGPLEIAAGTSIQRNHRLLAGSVNAEDTLPNNWTGSLTVLSSDSDINGFVQLTYYKNVSGDTFMAHDAFVLP